MVQIKLGLLLLTVVFALHARLVLIPKLTDDNLGTLPAGVRVIHLTGDDTMRFNLTTIEAAPGEALSVELKNVGRMPKQSMGHNFILLQPMSDAEVNAIGIAASMAAPTYLPKDLSKVIAHSTRILGSGESETIAFTAPTATGEYPYICTFPGHFATMRGKLIVK